MNATPAVVCWLLIGYLAIAHCTRNDTDNQSNSIPGKNIYICKTYQNTENLFKQLLKRAQGTGDGVTLKTAKWIALIYREQSQVNGQK